MMIIFTGKATYQRDLKKISKKLIPIKKTKINVFAVSVNS
jgi:hypothetical protein